MHTVEGNKATIDSFTQNLQSTNDTPFEATYTTTGSAPATVVYAVDPSERRARLPRDPDGIQRVQRAGDRQLVRRVRVQPERIGGAWSCQKLGQADAAAENKIFDLYTPSHWISFLKGVSLVAGLAGDKVTTSTMSLNGFDMNCVDLVAKRRAGHEHHLQHVPGHPRLRQGGVGLDELPDHRLLVVALAVAVPAAARRHRDDAHDLRHRPTSAHGVRTQ